MGCESQPPSPCFSAFELDWILLINTLLVCLCAARFFLCWFSRHFPNPSPAVSRQAHPVEPHSGQKAGRLILLTFPFSLQCDSLPPGQDWSDPGVFTDWPVTSLPSMHAASCRSLGGWNQSFGSSFYRPLFFFLSLAQNYCHVCSGHTCDI